MTRKDYITIARAFETALDTASVERREGILASIGFVTIELAKDSPLFDARRFIAACVKD